MTSRSKKKKKTRTISNHLDRTSVGIKGFIVWDVKKWVLLYGAEFWRTTKASMKKIQTFINQCLRRILRIHWPETISNENLWARVQQTPVEEDIQRRRWRWLGHMLRKLPSSIGRQGLNWYPEVNEREGDHGTPGDGSLKRILRGLDTHGNNLKG